MSTPVRTTWIQANAVAIKAGYKLDAYLNVVDKSSGKVLPVRGRAGNVDVRGTTGINTVSYNRLRWLLYSGSLPDTAVFKHKDGSLSCGGERIHPTKVADKPTTETFPLSLRDSGDSLLLGQYEALMVELKHRGIDPVRRVRIITTEVPL